MAKLSTPLYKPKPQTSPDTLALIYDGFLSPITSIPNRTIYFLLFSFTDTGFALVLLKQTCNHLPFTMLSALLFILYVQKYKNNHILDNTITTHKRKS